MELFLMRHGDADPGEGDDFARRLSDKGKKQAERMGAWLKDMRLAPILFVVSPFPRAHETADIVQGALGKGSVLQSDERLAPGMLPDTACAVIHELGGHDQRLCLVGHSPDLDFLAAYLIGARGGAVEMRKAAVAAFETARAGFGGSLMKWLINPKL